jgi:hypothetical protein
MWPSRVESWMRTFNLVAPLTAAEYLFELLRFGQLLQKILVDGGSEGGVEAHVA